MTLPLLDPTRWRRVLCVLAHPDDAEYGLSAAVEQWTRAGIEVDYLLLTSGEAGMRRSPEEAGPLRAAEQRDACDAVGVRRLAILDHPDGVLEYGLPLRRDIARAIRESGPDAVITANFDVEAYGSLNQADHRAAGLATVDAARDAGNRWVFRDLLDEGLEPWQPALLLVAGAAEPTHAVEVDVRAERAAVRSLECHRAYLADLPGHPAPGEFIPELLRRGGAEAEAERAVTFRVFPLGGIAAEE
ncbi:PIG-L deacetylase family protein [Gulosibacter sp. 10]|uniref:PIG-L deacetylase family protein n=1 Tax=Gulosibacter sp. 10 TaxID=1255570 RepID=UPI00097F5B0F|nr:PIG-L deacetylase family protein [Gulosibacter sp. 10]SJM56540.1 hypothetical protein FM112_04700 [Gulosibacter sp. 10]